MFHACRFKHLILAPVAVVALISTPSTAMASGPGAIGGFISGPASPTILPGFHLILNTPEGNEVYANCTACVIATSTTGNIVKNVGTSNLNVVTTSGVPVNQAAPALPGSSVYSQQFIFGGSLALTDGNGNNFLSANFNGLSIYAQPGSSSATVQFDLISASSNVFSLPASPYFIVTGTTTGPVPISTKSIPVAPYSWTNFDSMTIDWTAKVSSTPYAVDAVPEPSEWALFASGLGLVGFIAKRRFSRSRPTSDSALTGNRKPRVALAYEVGRQV